MESKEVQSWHSGQNLIVASFHPSLLCNEAKNGTLTNQNSDVFVRLLLGGGPCLRCTNMFDISIQYSMYIYIYRMHTHAAYGYSDPSICLA